MSRHTTGFIAIGIYVFWGLLLIAQKPGLQYDEALLVAGTVHLQHSAAPFDLEKTPRAWVCPFGRCIPLMSAFYVGSIKDYAALPLFALFGPRTPLVRLVSLILSALGIWGIYLLIAECFSRRTGELAAIIIAINPAFLDLTVFDDNAVAAMIAGLGLTCAAVALYTRRKTFWTAFTLGAAMGFAIWARANFVWVLVAGGAAGLLVFRRRFLISASHWMAVLLGGIAGGFPFLAFQLRSGFSTWKVQSAFAVTDPLGSLLRQRLFLFADMLLSDGEQRRMWDGPSLPAWQLWLFPSIVAAACLVCILMGARWGGRPFARFIALTFLLSASSLFFSRLQVAEHHLVVLVPFAAMTAAMAGVVLSSKFASSKLIWMRPLLWGVLSIYILSALYWDVATIRGLRKSGGVGVWSDAGLQLAKYLDRDLRGSPIKFLDWGLEYNMYVLTGGRLTSREIFSRESAEKDFDGHPWLDDIREGGVFVLNARENRQFQEPSDGFLRALASARPEMHIHQIAQRSGAGYADVIEIKAGTIRQGPADDPYGERIPTRISMADPRFQNQLSGFYSVDENRFRWTGRAFSVQLGHTRTSSREARLVMQLYVPDVIIQKLGPITMSARFGNHSLAPETWSRPGSYVYARELTTAGLTPGPVKIDFTLDKALPPSASDARELGIVVREISLEEF